MNLNKVFLIGRVTKDVEFQTKRLDILKDLE